MISLFGSGTLLAYGASKGGIVQLTKLLACGWAPVLGSLYGEGTATHLSRALSFM